MRALVTGATGFVGTHLVRALLAAGHDVHALVRDGSAPARVRGLLPATVHVHPGGIEPLLGTLDAARPEIVFHLAARFVAEHAPRDVAGLIDDNLRFGAELVEAMVRTGATSLVNTGTAWQHYGDAEYDPVCLYAATKEAFETLLVFPRRTAGLRVVTLVLFDTYGERDPRAKLMALLLRLAREGGSADFSPGEQRLDLVHVDDVAHAYLLAGARVPTLPAGAAEEYAVRSGDPVSLRELVRLFERECGRELGIRWGARPYRAREVMEPWAGGETLPGWRAEVPLGEGIRRLIAERELDARGD